MDIGGDAGSLGPYVRYAPNLIDRADMWRAAQRRRDVAFRIDAAPCPQYRGGE